MTDKSPLKKRLNAEEDELEPGKKRQKVEEKKKPVVQDSSEESFSENDDDDSFDSDFDQEED